MKPGPEKNARVTLTEYPDGTSAVLALQLTSTHWSVGSSASVCALPPIGSRAILTAGVASAFVEVVNVVDDGSWDGVAKVSSGVGVPTDPVADEPARLGPPHPARSRARRIAAHPVPARPRPVMAASFLAGGRRGRTGMPRAPQTARRARGARTDTHAQHS